MTIKQSHRLLASMFLGTIAAIALGAAADAQSIPQGMFRLTNMFLEGENLNLEGNKVAPGASLGGAAFMSPDSNASGVMWKAIPKGNGYFQLTTLFVEREGLVLEGNKVAQGSSLGGAAFMTPDTNASGTYWKMIPKENGYFQLTNMFLENEGLVLEGNKVAPGSSLGGAAFMSPDKNASGTYWKVIPFSFQ